MSFDLQEWLDRVWVQVGTEETETEKRLSRDELAEIAADACQDLAREIGGDPKAGNLGVSSLRHMLETVWRLPVIGGLGAASLVDDATKYGADGTTPATINMLSNTIRTVYYIPTEGARTRCYPLMAPEELDRPQPPGIIWWVLRDSVLETIDAQGKTRYTGNTLDGQFEVHATFIPTVSNFPNREELQPMLVRHMVRYARAKRDDRLAAALMGVS